MIRIAIVNQHPFNFGDDAAGVALVQQAFESLGASQVDVFYARHGGVGVLPVLDTRCKHRLLDDFASGQGSARRLARSLLVRLFSGKFRRRDLQTLISTCQQADAVFVSPGGANIGVYRDWSYLLTLMALVLSNIRPVFCQNTIGPSRSRIFNLISGFVLRRSELHVREAASADWLTGRGLSAYLGVDTAVLLNTDASSRPTLAESSAPYLAVVPTQLEAWFEAHGSHDDDGRWTEAFAVGVAASAIESNLPVVIVPHCHGAYSEEAYLERLATRISVAGASVRIAAPTDVFEYFALLAGATVVLSMRYHGLVLAAMAGVPCIAIPYENKMREAAQYLSLAEYLVDLEDIYEGHFTQMVARALADRDKVQARLREQTRVLQSIGLGPVNSVRSRLLRLAKHPPRVVRG